jgi:hypothetical protein
MKYTVKKIIQFIFELIILCGVILYIGYRVYKTYNKNKLP